MKQLSPHIDDILREYLADRFDGTSGTRRRRIETAERQLRRCLDEDGYRILKTGDLALLEIERQFAPDGAFARTMYAGDLLFALDFYVREPWLLEDRLDRAAQLRLAEGLAAMILRRGLVDEGDYTCALLELRGGLNRAKAELTRERRAAQPTQPR